MAATSSKGLQLYNTLTRKKEPFVPLRPPRVGMYVCGLTVYDYAHIGHARTHVAFETIRRWLAFRGYDVLFVQNVTDVDDKIIDRARELKVDPQEHAAKWTQICNADMANLGVSPPDVQPKVTEHIDHIVRLIEKLVANGHAYRARDGSVYYRVAKKKDYGKLSNRSPDELMAGARVDPAEGKEDPKDFALWKAVKPGEPWWNSPWGKGRPGWHIECSAMAATYLGETFDIHGGGVDLVFPHHENEVAQSEGASGKQFVKYWLHTGFLTVGGEKMSKSLKNFIPIHDILKDHDPEVIRFFYANTHYRSGIDYTKAALEDAGRGLERLRRVEADLAREAAKWHGPAIRGKENGPPAPAFSGDARLIQASTKLADDFGHAMDDDFNTREAVAALFGFVTDANKALTDGISPSAGQLAHSTFVRHARTLTVFDKKAAGATGPLDELVGLLLRIRDESRSKKDFKTSDLVRDELKRIGVDVEDTAKAGAKWRLKA
ncbi:MAG: cysteine--tRNA ligase [Euryarchaeota archaeon]|nr:cysteine--tRNA ligase [Euryarchaeota archaeon]